MRPTRRLAWCWSPAAPVPAPPSALPRKSSPPGSGATELIHMTAAHPRKLSAVVFDWAGTIIDFGSCAPMGAFVKLFRQFEIDISIDDARGPMGMAKWDHIQALGRLPRVAAQWQKRYGKPFADSDVDHLYEIF